MRNVILIPTTLLATFLLGCNRMPGASPGADISKLKVGMSGDEVRRQLGEPSPGGSYNNLATGQSQERWIYGAGDDALFITVSNGKVQGFQKKRCTMKDAAAKIKAGMSRAEVIAMLGQPEVDSDAGGGKRAISFSNKDAAIDSLRVELLNDRVVGSQVIPNSALNAQGSASR